MLCLSCGVPSRVTTDVFDHDHDARETFSRSRFEVAGSRRSSILSRVRSRRPSSSPSLSSDSRSEQCSSVPRQQYAVPFYPHSAIVWYRTVKQGNPEPLLHLCLWSELRRQGGREASDRDRAAVRPVGYPPHYPPSVGRAAAVSVDLVWDSG